MPETNLAFWVFPDVTWRENLRKAQEALPFLFPKMSNMESEQFDSNLILSLFSIQMARIQHDERGGYVAFLRWWQDPGQIQER